MKNENVMISILNNIEKVIIKLKETINISHYFYHSQEERFKK
jgi:hypothetical protein